MTTPDELRAELHRIKGLTASNDRELQELLADTLISIADSLATLAASVTATPTAVAGRDAFDDARATDWDPLPTSAPPAEPEPTPEQQMMDAVRPTEAGQKVAAEGGNGFLGTVTGFGNTEGRDYAIVDFPDSEGARIWVESLMVVTEEPSHGSTDEQFDLVVGDEDDEDPDPMPTAPRETTDPFPWTNDGVNFYSVPVRLDGEWSTFAPREGKPAKSKKAKKKAKN